ncbi:hypothetical protein ACH5RR_016109 [Cinchona calisaya]|uniref:Chromatin assembly factor 1 subunit FAS1 n=1 Tax=Cinchona calisaya TaxID=153742 RepID=A0ABD2ZYF5_9GENT
MAEPMVIDGNEAAKRKMNGSAQKKSVKRKRGGGGGLTDLTPDEKSAKIEALREELKSLFYFYRELNNVKENENVEDICNVDSAIAVLMEESGLPLSKLVVEIFEKLKGKFGNGNGDNGGGGLSSLASVKSRVLLIGQRVYYGISNADADLLEDDSESALWCWETRDMKLVPKSMRAVLKSRRTYRKKIQERVTTISAMIAALEKTESHQNYQELMKASERLRKTLNEADIRLLVDNVLQKTGAEVAMKEAKQDEKILIKQLEKNKREEEKEKRRMERELQKEKLQTEKEQKRLQDEAEKEERRREKEESEMKKLLKRQQEEVEKDQRRREKEEAEKKNQLSLKKEASFMERFLKRGKTDSSIKNDHSPSNAISNSSPKSDKEIPESVTLAMDSVLSKDDGTKANEIWELHLNSWHQLGFSIRSNRHMHWGIRRKPKTELVKELKLSSNRGLAREDDMSIEKLVDGWVISSNESFSPTNKDSTIPNSRMPVRGKQLLQFDKSHRPAFYGVRMKKSQVVSARHPFAKDPELDYEIDSDEEWEEEEPGESLSDCDKDGEEESLDEGCSKGDDDESEDGFFVPDGYLSADEGIEVDKLDLDDLVEETRSLPNSKESLPSDAVNQLLQQQKYLHNLTEHALRKNKPLIVLNFMHQKAHLLSADVVTGAEKLEQMCLQALSICAFPDGPSVQISISDDREEDQGACTSNSKASSTTCAGAPTILDSDLRQIVSVIQSCSHGINKVVESLHEKFPSISKSQLRNIVREISDFVDNRWQVKKDILVKLGSTISPEKSSARTKSIATFFSKRCLPPLKSIDPNETSPQTSRKTVASTRPEEGAAQ